MAKIFISYSDKDAGDARDLSAFLTPELGSRHEVFLARDKIPAGENWERTLLEQLRDMDALVCLVTPNFIQSHWCTAEVSVARTQGKRILPLKAGADPTEIPMLKLVHFLDYTAKSQDQRKELLNQLRAFVGAVGTTPGPGQLPFPGLAPFDQDLAWAFSGAGRRPSIWPSGCDPCDRRGGRAGRGGRAAGLR